MPLMDENTVFCRQLPSRAAGAVSEFRADERFFLVLQGSDTNVIMAAATYLQSSSGTSFDGAQFSSAAVYFPVSGSTPFAGTTMRP